MASVTDSESNEGKDGKKMGIEKGKAEVSPSDHLVSDVEVDPRSPVELANWLMYLSFAWAGPFLKLGSTQTLKKEDMYNIPKSYESRYLQERLQLCWESEVARVAGRNAGVDGQDGMMILRAAIKCFKPHLIVAALILIGHSAVHIFQAKAVGWLVGYFEDSDAEAWEGWLYAGLVVLSGFLFSCAHHHFFYYAWTLGMQLRVATTAISYNKILRLRLSSLGEVTTGYLVNLASSDVERFQYGGMFVHYLWLAPLETLVILYFGLREVGVSFLAGFAALALLIPLQACFSKRFMQVRKNVTSLTDERVKLTSQAITGARLMKINAWEPALEREISRVRSEEVHALLRAMTLRAINEAMFFAQPAVISLLVFLTYHYTGGVLESPKVFTTLALLNITQFTLGKFFYLAVQACSESWVSMQRLEKLLLMKENEVLSETTADGSKDQEEQTQGQLKMLGEDQKAVGGGGMGKEFVPSQHSISPSNDVSQSSGRIVMHQASFKWGHGDDDNGNAGLGSEVERSEGKGSDGSRRGLESELQVMGRDCGSGEKDDGDGNTKGTESVSGGAIAEEKIEDGVPGDDNVIDIPNIPSPNNPAKTQGKTPLTEGQWSGNTLEDIDLEVQQGQLVGVVGAVGSAKSSLLLAVLREMMPVKDIGNGKEMTVEGRVAYASQEPWIQSGTVRENVLFGKPMNRERYDKVISACALVHDLASLPSGDLTGIGDRGVNLSGGQKARIGLARMAYSEADLYLMDDPLSAVDPAVGRVLFDRVICGWLRGKTRLLVTHQVHYLSAFDVDVILVMNNGRIMAQGRYQELSERGHLSVVEREKLDAEETNESSLNTLPVSSIHVEVTGTPNTTTPNTIKVKDATITDECGNMGSPTKAGVGVEDPNLVKVGEGDLVVAVKLCSDGQEGVGQKFPREGRQGSRVGVVLSRDGMDDVMRRASMDSRLSSFDMGAIMGDQLEVCDTQNGKEKGHDHDQDNQELVVEEDKEVGTVKKSTYIQYVKEAAGLWTVVVIILLMALGQVLILSVNVWLAEWSRESAESQERMEWPVVFGCLASAALIVSMLRSLLTFYALVEASHKLHKRMLNRILRAPVIFFDSNPVGRILNRFTKDTHLMDDMLPMTVFDFIICTFMVTGSTILILVVNPWVILSLLPATAYFYWLLQFYFKTSREVKRLEATTRSPVYSQLSETLDGLVTIRAFGEQSRFLSLFMDRVNLNTRAYYAYIFTARWLGFRMDMVVLIVLIGSCFFSVAVNENSSSIDAGLLGAALVYVIQLGGLFQWTVRQSAEVENQMVSTERVLAYCRVSQESNLTSDADKAPPTDWPTKGKIEMRNLVLRYRSDLPPVLNGLTLTVEGGSRVGVVGRTGAGKSTLISALFRLVEQDVTDEGSIFIDGIDIFELGLHDLRPRMSVIPQTPFLFSGSVRVNLDPFNKHSDADIWASLEAVQMKNYVVSLNGGLNAIITEGGQNLSVGQRQLICLARAVLQRSQILVMDEATANIDYLTDSLIQDAVRTEFNGCTVVMVAHRINTIIDCDQVIVLSDGKVVEFGHPHELLSGSNSKGDNTTENEGTFSSMVQETGTEAANELRRLAEEAWTRAQTSK